MIDGTDDLAALERRLAHDLEVLNYPPANWVPPRHDVDGRPLLDVLVVGGGMCGLTAAFALRRLGISNIRVIDAAEPGLEGPWITFARMQTLRSPKHLTGPAQGLPSLAFRSWFGARFGEDPWERLGRIPRPMWAEYLAWYGRVTGAGVESRRRLLRLVPKADHVIAQITDAGGLASHITARKVVLATGRDTLARPRIPAALAPLMGRGVLHASDAIDFAALEGRHVTVVGVQAAAFDNAGEALEAGAREVVLLARAPAMPRVNKAKQIVYAGFVHGFPELSDEDRLRTLMQVLDHRIAPPRESVQRVARHAGARIRLGTEITGAHFVDGRIRLATTTGPIETDAVILGTGFEVDVAADPALAGIAPRILRWSDRVRDLPEAGELLAFPCLDAGFRFQPRTGTDDAALARLHCFNHAAMVSLGNLANDIPAVSEGADRLARAVAVDLFREDRAVHRQRLADYWEPELLGDEWDAIAAWSPPVAT
jgi:hypothetical protein